jgi:hypothetical protein
MAATTKTFDTTVEAAPQLQFDRHHGGGLKVYANTVELATTNIDDIGDKVMLLAVPGNARLIDLVIFNDDLDTNVSPTLAADIGLYYGDGVTGKAPGDIIDVDAFATAITTLQAANTVGVRVGYEALDINKIGKPLWEIGALTRDPGLVYIGLNVTAAAATGAAGTVTVYALVV